MPRERVLGAPSASGDSLPFSLSASLLRVLASSRAHWLGSWTPGFKPSSLPALTSPRHPSLSPPLFFPLSPSLSLPPRDPELLGPSAPHPPSPGGDGGLGVTGARPLPLSLPGWRARHSPPPPPRPGGEEEEGERPRRRTKGPGRPPPPFPQPLAPATLTLSNLCGGWWWRGGGARGRPPSPAPALQKGCARWLDRRRPVASGFRCGGGELGEEGAEPYRHAPTSVAWRWAKGAWRACTGLGVSVKWCVTVTTLLFPSYSKSSTHTCLPYEGHPQSGWDGVPVQVGGSVGIQTSSL